MAVMFSGPFASLFNLQQTLDASRASSWLESGPSGSGSYFDDSLLGGDGAVSNILS